MSTQRGVSSSLPNLRIAIYNLRSTTVEVMILQYVCLTLSDDPGGAPKAWAVLGITVKMAEAVCATC